MLRSPVSVIRSRSPDHPASSFYYPDTDQLPTILTYTLHKVNEFSSVKLETKQNCPRPGHSHSASANIKSENVSDSELVTISSFDVSVRTDDNTLLKLDPQHKKGGIKLYKIRFQIHCFRLFSKNFNNWTCQNWKQNDRKCGTNNFWAFNIWPGVTFRRGESRKTFH